MVRFFKKLGNIKTAILYKIPFLNRSLSDPDNREILKGTGTTFYLKIFGLGFSYVFYIIFARLYGAEVIGLYGLTLTVVGIFSLIGLLGTQSSTVRFIAQYKGQNDYHAIKESYKKVLQLILPISIILAVILYSSSTWIAIVIFKKPLLADPLRITSFILPFSALLGINTSSLQGLKKIKDSFIFSTVLPPALNIIGLTGLTYIIMRNYLTPIYANLIMVGILAISSSVLWVKKTKYFQNITQKPDLKKRISIKRILKISLPMFMVSAMAYIMGWTDTFMLGIYNTSADVGIYKIAMKISMLISWAGGSVYSIITPKFSELYWGKKDDKLKDVAKFASKLMIFLSVPALILVVFFAKPILGMFGLDFIKGSTALIIICIGEFIKAVFGPVGYFLIMTDQEKYARNAISIGAITNIIFNLWLIPLFGIVGAAFATVMSTIVWHFIASAYIYKLHGYWMGYLPFKK
jgi:O-antigen/teichoic acid export membrane protein